MAPTSACTNACAGTATARPGPADCYIHEEERAMSRATPAEHVAQNAFTVHTRGRGFSEITDKVVELVAASGVHTGIVNIFTTHTSCSLLISENADPKIGRAS